MKNLGAGGGTEQDGDGRDATLVGEVEPCASRSSGTSSSASSCDGDETDAKAFDAAESGGEASRRSARQFAPFARDLVACGCRRGVLRGRPEPTHPLVLESSDDSLPSVERACSAPPAPGERHRGGSPRASVHSDKMARVVHEQVFIRGRNETGTRADRGNVYIKRANRKQTRRDEDALVQERLLHLPPWPLRTPRLCPPLPRSR